MEREERPGERPRLLIVGGNGSAPSRFLHAWPYLEKQFRPTLVEVAGQGGRARAALPDSFDGFVEDLRYGLRQAAGGKGALCYGHGIGGLLLAHAVRRSPEIASRLILHSPVGVQLGRGWIPRWLAWRPLGEMARALLGSPLLGPIVAGNLLEPGGAVRHKDRVAFAAGYRQARSFLRLFSLIDPLSALDGLETLSLPVTLLWGERDAVLSPNHLPAWAELLSGATVTARLIAGWRHYPYMDRPAEFAAVLEECHLGSMPEVPVSLDELACFNPRTKTGRLAAMRRAGLPVPPGWWVPPAALENGSAARLFAAVPSDRRYAVRSSAAREDQSDRTAAGVYESELDVSPGELLDACRRVARSGKAEYFSAAGDSLQDLGRCDILLQEMAPREAGGVAWVRALGIDLEIGPGDFQRGVAGSAEVVRASLSTLGKPWSEVPARLPGGLRARRLRAELWPLLRRAHALFEAGTLDMEWAYDRSVGFGILQARPVGEQHPARRLLTAANLREVAPPEPSRFLLGTLEAVSPGLPRYYARSDQGIGAWREPFTVNVAGRAYINADFYVALMDRWGLPRSLVSRAIGGSLPGRAPRPDRLLRSLPALARLAADWPRLFPRDTATLEQLRRGLDSAEGAAELATWFVGAFHTLVESMLRITGALAAALPLWIFAPPPVVTAVMAAGLRAAERDGRPEAWAIYAQLWGHRGEYESDPASPRGEEHLQRRNRTADAAASEIPALPPDPPFSPLVRPTMPDPLGALPRPIRRVPMLAPRHLQAHREWFKDGVMRLWAAFRARMLAESAALVRRGCLDRIEQIWHLTPAEITTLPVERWRAAAQAGAAPRPAALDADLFWSDTLEALSSPGAGGIEQRDRRRLPLVAGIVSGPALVARTPSEALALLPTLREVARSGKPDEWRPILLAPAVDPGWLPVFVRVAGAAVELGGRLSHAATLLPEMRIPSVLNLPGVTQVAATGETVELRVPPGEVRRRE